MCSLFLSSSSIYCLFCHPRCILLLIPWSWPSSCVAEVNTTPHPAINNIHPRHRKYIFDSQSLLTPSCVPITNLRYDLTHAWASIFFYASASHPSAFWSVVADASYCSISVHMSSDSFLQIESCRCGNVMNAWRLGLCGVCHECVTARIMRSARITWSYRGCCGK